MEASSVILNLAVTERFSAYSSRASIRPSFRRLHAQQSVPDGLGSGYSLQHELSCRCYFHVRRKDTKWFFFYADSIGWRVCDFAKFLLLYTVYLHLARVGVGDVKGAA